MDFNESALKGDVFDLTRAGLITGCLYAIGTSWAISIQAIMRELAIGTPYLWLAELSASLVVSAGGTIIAVAVAKMPRPRLPRVSTSSSDTPR